MTCDGVGGGGRKVMSMVGFYLKKDSRYKKQNALGWKLRDAA